MEDLQNEAEDRIGALLALLRDRSRDNYYHGQFPLRDKAVKELVKLGTEAVEPLCLALQDDDIYTRRFAAEALGQIGDPRAVLPLIHAFQRSSQLVQPDIARSLAKVADAQAVAPLYAALSQPKIAQASLDALAAVLQRTAYNVSTDDLRLVACLDDAGRALVEVPDTDGGYLAWNEVEVQLDYRPVKQLAQQELTRRGLAM